MDLGGGIVAARVGGVTDPIVIYRGSYRKIMAVMPKYDVKTVTCRRRHNTSAAPQQTGPQKPSRTRAGWHAKCGTTPSQSRKISKNRQPAGQPRFFYQW